MLGVSKNVLRYFELLNFLKFWPYFVELSTIFWSRNCNFQPDDSLFRALDAIGNIGNDTAHELRYWLQNVTAILVAMATEWIFPHFGVIYEFFGLIYFWVLNLNIRNKKIALFGHPYYMPSAVWNQQRHDKAPSPKRNFLTIEVAEWRYLGPKAFNSTLITPQTVKVLVLWWTFRLMINI